MDRLDQLFDETPVDPAELDRMIAANAEGDGPLYVVGYFLAFVFAVFCVVGYLAQR